MNPIHVSIQRLPLTKGKKVSRFCCNKQIVKYDDAVSSVVGELLILVLVIILVSILAVSAFNLLPGERISVVNVVMEPYAAGNDNLTFYHKGGDWIEAAKIRLTVTPENKGKKIVLSPTLPLKDYGGKDTDIFDLGGRCSFEITGVPDGEYSLRLVSSDAVLYSKDNVILSHLLP